MSYPWILEVTYCTCVHHRAARINIISMVIKYFYLKYNVKNLDCELVIINDR